MEKARGVPWNTVMGSTRSKPEAVTSELSVPQVPQVTSEELYGLKTRKMRRRERQVTLKGWLRQRFLQRDHLQFHKFRCHWRHLLHSAVGLRHPEQESLN